MTPHTLFEAGADAVGSVPSTGMSIGVEAPAASQRTNVATKPDRTGPMNDRPARPGRDPAHRGERRAAVIAATGVGLTFLAGSTAPRSPQSG